VGYVLTTEQLQQFRVFLMRTATPEATALLNSFDYADGLDSERLAELATLARDEARSNGPSFMTPQEVAQGLARDARIVELATDVLTALALDKLPATAVLSLGRECYLCDVEQPDDIASTCTSAGCPRRAEFDAGVRVNGSALHWPTTEERAGMREAAEYIEAANSKPGEPLTREQVEALPSHDRAVLSRIFGELLGEPGSGLGDESAELVWDEVDAARAALADSLGAPLLSTWPDIIRIAAERCPQGTTWRNAMELAGLGMTRREGERLRGFETEISKLLGMPRSGTAEMFEVLQRALNRPTVEASRYSLPEFHPLRLYQWAEWLRRMLAADELASDAGFGLDVNGRLEWLRAALERVEALDVNGLRGLVELAHDDRELSPLSNAENRLLLFACGCGRLAQLTEGKSFIGAGCHRIPRVRGETVEVGK
jgi:hypothetical protein